MLYYAMMQTKKYKLHMSVDVPLVLMDSGQVFHWRELAGQPGVFAAVTDGHAALVRGTPDGLEVTVYNDAAGDDAAFWDHYFDAARDYALLRVKYASFAHIAEAMEAMPGLRVLNQPPWEVLIAFILSANNNVSRIRALVMAICRELGARFDVAGEAVFAFPEPDVLMMAGEARLRALGVGYRAPFLIQTARMVAEGFPLGGLRDMPYEAAHKRLQELPGVGPKVADCVLLFGCAHAMATPVDVWIERVLRGQFELSGSKAQLKRQAIALLGEDAGVVQQYLFHAARTGLLAHKLG